MKKIFLLSCILFLIVGCNTHELHIDTFKVAVVETASNKKDSKITYYNENLEIIDSAHYRYAEFGTHFSNMEYNNGKVYFVPKGLAMHHNDQKIVSINLSDGNLEEYPIKRSHIQGTNADGDYVYAASNNNGINYITQYNTANKTTKEVEIESSYTSLIMPYKQKVYAFVEGMYGSTYIHIYNQDLELLNIVNISSTGRGQGKATIINDQLFFSCPYNRQDSENNIVGILNLEDNSLKTITLHQTFPSDIKKYDDKIIVSHTNEVITDNSSSIISIVDINDNSTIEHDLGCKPLRIEVLNNMLYVLSTDDYIHIFDINDNFKEIRKVKHTLDKGLYTTGIFVSEYQ